MIVKRSWYYKLMLKRPQEIKDEAERILPEIDKVYEELLNVEAVDEKETKACSSFKFE